MENLDIRTKIISDKIINYYNKQNLHDPVSSITISIRSLTGIDISLLESYIQNKGMPWENAKVVFKDLPNRVECNVCGTRFSADEEWTPCPDCGCPGAFIDVSSYRMDLKEISLENGQVIKAKKAILLR